MTITIIKGIVAVDTGTSSGGGGSGTVTSGGAGQIAYYSTGGTSVTGNPALKFNDTIGVLNFSLVGDPNSLAIGASAMQAQASAAGIFNIAIGRDAMANVNAQAAGSPSNLAINNIAIGYKALQNAGGSDNSDGSSNVAIGRNAMALGAVVSGISNVFVGDQAGLRITGGNQNVGIGSAVLATLTTGSANVCLGAAAGGSLTTGEHNTIIGNEVGAVLQVGVGNILIGVDSTLTTGIGSSNLCIIKGIGTAVVSATNLDTKPIINLPGTVNIGQAASQGVITLLGSSNGAVTIQTLASAGTWTLTLPDSAGNNGQTLITNGAGITSWATGGAGSGTVTSGGAGQITWYGTGGTTVGANENITLTSAGGATFAAAVTANSLHINTIISAVGNINAGANLVAGAATFIVSGDTGAVFAGSTINTSAHYLINNQNAIRFFRNDNTPGASLAVGASALAAQTGTSAAYNNTAIGFQAMGNSTLTTAAVNNTAIGAGALSGLTSGTNNVGIGTNAGVATTILATGSANVIIGASAHTNATSTDNAVSIGNNPVAGASGIAIGRIAGATGTACVAIGNNANTGNGNSSVAIGTNAGNGTFSSESVAIGDNAGNALTGANGTVIGGLAGRFITTGIGNTALGYQAMQGITGTKNTGNSSTAIGNNAGFLLQGLTSRHVLIGASAGEAMTTCSGNVVIGPGVCNTTLQTGSNNIYIGCSNAIDSTAAGTSNELKIGNSSTPVISATSIQGTPVTLLGGTVGIGATTTTYQLTLEGAPSSTSVLKVRNTGVSAFSEIDFYDSSNSLAGWIGTGNASSGSRNQFFLGSVSAAAVHFLTNNTSAMSIATNQVITMVNLAGTGSRAVIADANGVLSAPVSDLTLKENIQPISYGLKDIQQLKPVSFHWKPEYNSLGKGRQIGLIAQEVEKIIPEAVGTMKATGKMYIDQMSIVPVMIKAIQELQVEVNKLKERV